MHLSGFDLCRLCTQARDLVLLGRDGNRTHTPLETEVLYEAGRIEFSGTTGSGAALFRSVPLVEARADLQRLDSALR
jgi:hypothetical protein